MYSCPWLVHRAHPSSWILCCAKELRGAELLWSARTRLVSSGKPTIDDEVREQIAKFFCWESFGAGNIILYAQGSTGSERFSSASQASASRWTNSRVAHTGELDFSRFLPTLSLKIVGVRIMNQYKN